MAVIEEDEVIIERLRKDASFLKMLTKAPGWERAYLIDEVEAQKISATIIEAAQRIEALEIAAAKEKGE